MEPSRARSPAVYIAPWRCENSVRSTSNDMSERFRGTARMMETLVIGIGAVLVGVLLWQQTVRARVSRRYADGARYLDALLAAADVLSWGDPEVRARIDASAEDPDRYFEDHPRDFGMSGDVWPFRVLCVELERRDLAVAAGLFFAPDKELADALTPALARCGAGDFDWSSVDGFGKGGPLPVFLDALAASLARRDLVLVCLDDGSHEKIVAIQPEERYVAIDRTKGPDGSYMIYRRTDLRAESPA